MSLHFFFLFGPKHIFYEYVERNKEQHLAKTCVFFFFFLNVLEQTRFCGTLGNRSERLSSGKLWANINEAFKIGKKRKRNEAHLKFAESCLRATRVGQTTVRLCVTLFNKIALTTGLDQRPFRVLCMFQSGFLKH